MAWEAQAGGAGPCRDRPAGGWVRRRAAAILCPGSGSQARRALVSPVAPTRANRLWNQRHGQIGEAVGMACVRPGEEIPALLRQSDRPCLRHNSGRLRSGAASRRSAVRSRVRRMPAPEVEFAPFTPLSRRPESSSIDAACACPLSSCLVSSHSSIPPRCICRPI